MPTIFARLDGSLAGNDLSARVTLQSDNLTRVIDAVNGLIQHPPQNIGDLGQALSELPLPDLQISGDFGAALGQVRAAVPADLSGVTCGLLAELAALSGRLD